MCLINLFIKLQYIQMHPTLLFLFIIFILFGLFSPDYFYFNHNTR
jgi:hypothetical protein